jgi:hypothetical protein
VTWTRRTSPGTRTYGDDPPPESRPVRSATSLGLCQCAATVRKGFRLCLCAVNGKRSASQFFTGVRAQTAAWPGTCRKTAI